MRLSEIIELLSARIHTDIPDIHLAIDHGRASDLLSDVLMYPAEKNSVLLTGLVNPQVIRTAEMMDIKAVVLVRNKQPTEEMISLAVENNIILLSTHHKLFVCCGLLYSKGLRD